MFEFLVRTWISSVFWCWPIGFEMRKSILYCTIEDVESIILSNGEHRHYSWGKTLTKIIHEELKKFHSISVTFSWQHCNENISMYIYLKTFRWLGKMNKESQDANASNWFVNATKMYGNFENIIGYRKILITLQKHSVCATQCCQQLNSQERAIVEIPKKTPYQQTDRRVRPNH